MEGGDEDGVTKAGKILKHIMLYNYAS